MARDLGTDAGQVHDHARAVLRFWLEETPAEKHFEQDAALDAEIARRFGPLRDAVLAGDGAGWGDTPDAILAAIILLDQFSRNLHRGSAEAFAGDALARSLAERAITRGWDADLPADRRVFLYMPFMHAEAPGDQERSVALFGDPELGIPDNLKYARDHAAVIECFGRFPVRNAALGRNSTPEEEAYLSQPDAGS